MGVAITVLALFSAFVWWFSRSEASNDAHRIGLHLNIDHGDELSQRILLVCCTAAVCAIWVGWSALLLLPLGYGLFSWPFRWRLNSLRGKHRHYVSPSSNYDYVFMWLAGFRGGRKYWTSVWSNSVVIENVSDTIHRAGRLATTVEITVATIAAGAFLWVNYAR